MHSNNYYKIVVDQLAAKDLFKLNKSDRKLAHKITILIGELAFEPAAGKPLTGEKKGCYSLRYGDWRIIYEVYHSQKTVHIIRIGHRKDIYR